MFEALSDLSEHVGCTHGFPQLMFPMVDAARGQEISEHENKNDFEEENSVDKERINQTV